MQLVGRFLSLPEAEIAASRLRAEGIEAQVFDQLTPGFISLGAGEATGVRLMVPTGDVPEAVEILRARPDESTDYEPVEPSHKARWAALMILAIMGLPLVISLMAGMLGG